MIIRYLDRVEDVNAVCPSAWILWEGELHFDEPLAARQHARGGAAANPLPLPLKWGAVKELILSHHIRETILLMIYIYTHIYIYIPIMVAEYKFLNSNPANSQPP